MDCELNRATVLEIRPVYAVSHLSTQVFNSKKIICLLQNLDIARVPRIFEDWHGVTNCHLFSLS